MTKVMLGTASVIIYFLQNHRPYFILKKKIGNDCICLMVCSSTILQWGEGKANNEFK